MSKPLLQPKHEALIARLARMTGSLGGLESIMMAGQYSAPIIISLLLALAKLRDTYPRLRAGAGGKALGAGAAGASLRQLALGWGKAAESFGEWRTVSRLVGTSFSDLQNPCMTAGVHEAWDWCICGTVGYKRVAVD